MIQLSANTFISGVFGQFPSKNEEVAGREGAGARRGTRRTDLRQYTASCDRDYVLVPVEVPCKILEKLMSKDRDAAGVFRAPSAQLLMCMVLHSDAVAIAEYPSGCSVRRSVGRAACIPSELNRLFTQAR